MDLATHFRVIAQNWLRILVISLVLAAVVFSPSFRSTYRATETLSIRRSNGRDRTDAPPSPPRCTEVRQDASFLTAVV